MIPFQQRITKDKFLKYRALKELGFLPNLSNSQICRITGLSSVQMEEVLINYKQYVKLFLKHKSL